MVIVFIYISECVVPASDGSFAGGLLPAISGCIAVDLIFTRMLAPPPHPRLQPPQSRIIK
jgi:hypothetical protein